MEMHKGYFAYTIVTQKLYVGDTIRIQWTGRSSNATDDKCPRYKSYVAIWDYTGPYSAARVQNIAFEGWQTDFTIPSNWAGSYVYITSRDQAGNNGGHSANSSFGNDFLNICRLYISACTAPSIGGKGLNAAVSSAAGGTYEYTGNTISPFASLDLNKYFTITNAGNLSGKEVGNYTFTLKPLPQYQWESGDPFGERSFTWKISPAQQSGAYITGDSSVTVGGTLQLGVNGILGGATHTYSVAPSDVASIDQNGKLTAKKPGTVRVTVIIPAVGNYAATTITKDITINAKPVSGLTVTVDDSGLVYNGTSHKPAVTVKDGTTLLKEGTDYKLEYSDNKNAGTGTVTVTGIGNYDGSIDRTFTIAKASQSFTLYNSVTATAVEQYSGSIADLIDGTYAGALSVTASPEGILTVGSDGSYTVHRDGEVTLTVTAAGNDNYAPSAAVTQTVKVTLQDGFRVGDVTYASLQDAVDAANNGATITVVGAPVIDDTVTVDKQIVISGGNGAVISRGAELDALLSVKSGGSLTLKNVTLDGKRSKDTVGPMVTVTSGGELTVGSGACVKGGNGTGNGAAIGVNGGKLVVKEGATFTDNITSNGYMGGAIYADSGSVVIEGGSFTGNNARDNGGAIAVEGTASLKVTGGTFQSNSAAPGGQDNTETGANGGAIWVGGDAEAQITGGTFKGNTALAIDNMGSGGGPAFGGAVAVGGGTVTIGGTATFEGNTSLLYGSQYAANGGALAVTGGTVIVNGGKFTNNSASNEGGAVYVSGGSLKIEGGTFAGNTAQNGGALAVVEGSEVIVNGGEIHNNKAAGTGNGVYLGGSAHISLDGSSATAGIEDAFGIGESGQIEVTGELTHRVNVEFADPETQVDEVYVTSGENGGQALKDNFRVTNPGYTFDPNADTENGELKLIKSSSVVAVVDHGDGTYTNYTSVQEAIDAAQEGETVLFATYTNKAVQDGSLDTTEVILNETLVIPAGKKITFGSVNVVASLNEDGETMDYEYVMSDNADFEPVTVKRGSFTEEMIRVEEGGSLTIGNEGAAEDTLIFDGGAVWGEADKPVVSDDGNGTPGSAQTGNTGITAHAPVIVNRGELVMEDGAAIRNNDNNYAAPGKGFGSENYGGGIRNEGAGSFTMNGGSIENCYSREGGAIININKPNTKNDGSYVSGGNPTVTIHGGTIEGNASQMKGSAIQTIYGGATTVINGGEITANTSLHDYGTFAAEEGGSLTVAGGTANVNDANSGCTTSGGTTPNIEENENLIYIYNKYAEADIAGAADGSKPFVEGNGAAQVQITTGTNGSPVLGGNIHLDAPCEVFDEDGVTGGEDYYHPVVDISGYEGERLTVTVDAGRDFGKVVVSDAAADLAGDSAKVEVTFPEYSASAGYDGTRFTYVESSNGEHALNFGGFDIKIEQAMDESGASVIGKVVISGTADPALDGVTVTIGGQNVTLKIDENGNIREEVALDLSAIGGLADDFTASSQAQAGGENAGNQVTISNSLELEKAVAKAEAEQWYEDLKTSASNMGLDGSALDTAYENALSALEGAKSNVAGVLTAQKDALFDALKDTVKAAIEEAAGDQTSDAIKTIVDKYVDEGTGKIDSEETIAGVEIEYGRALAELAMEQAREEVKDILGDTLYNEATIDGKNIDEFITGVINEIIVGDTPGEIEKIADAALEKVYDNESIIGGVLKDLENKYGDILNKEEWSDVDLAAIEQAAEDLDKYPEVVKNSQAGQALAEKLEDMRAEALQSAKDKAAAAYEEAVANAEQAVKDNGFGSVPSQDAQQAVKDAIAAAGSLAQINDILGEAVKEIVGGLTVEGDSPKTEQIAENGKGNVDSAVESATDSGSLADIAGNVTSVAAEIKVQRDEEKLDAKQEIGNGANALYPDGASDELAEVIDEYVSEGSGKIDGVDLSGGTASDGEANKALDDLFEEAKAAIELQQQKDAAKSEYAEAYEAINGGEAKPSRTCLCQAHATVPKWFLLLLLDIQCGMSYNK